MPNHVANELVITGEPSTLEDFARTARELPVQWKGSPKPEVFNRLELSQFVHPELAKRGQELSIPYSDLAGGGPMGYDWCIKNWGTKWGAYDCIYASQEIHGPGKISYQFNTAWSPFNPEVSLAMSKLFPTLRFELNYFEPGMAFKGTRIWNDAEGIVSDECTNFDWDQGDNFQHQCIVSAG
jgi:hypothetical protein